MMKEAIKKLLNIMPLGNYIMFESVPDLSDNVMPVFEELVNRGFNKKYKMIWWVKDMNANLPKYKNVSYIDKNSFYHKLLFQWYRVRSKCLICCNQVLTKVVDKQTALYLTHGTIIKSVRSYYTLPDGLDYMLVASEASKEVMAYEFNIDIKKVVALGFPRNDVMGKVNMDLTQYFGKENKKIIVWYPTFRQNKNGGKTNCNNALPILHDTGMAMKLNDIAKKKGVLLVVKPHFAQDVSYIKDYNLSNIVFINDSFFKENNITSYEFVASCDGLITDYSSIFYDYLLCDKPIAVVWEDIDEYRQNPGFGVDPEEMMKCANKVYNLDEFAQFITDVADEHDVYKALRKEINTWANYANDGKNTERVTDFIIERANL